MPTADRVVSRFYHQIECDLRILWLEEILQVIGSVAHFIAEYKNRACWYHPQERQERREKVVLSKPIFCPGRSKDQNVHHQTFFTILTDISR